MDGIDKVLTALREARVPLLTGILWLQTVVVVLAGLSAPGPGSREALAIERLNDWREVVPQGTLALIVGGTVWVVGAISVDATRFSIGFLQNRLEGRQARKEQPGQDAKSKNAKPVGSAPLQKTVRAVCERVVAAAVSEQHQGIGSWETLQSRLNAEPDLDKRFWLDIHTVESVLPGELHAELSQPEILEHSRGIAGLNASRRYFEAELRVAAAVPAGFLILALGLVFSKILFVALVPLVAAVVEWFKSLAADRQRLLHAVELGLVDTPTTNRLRSIGKTIGSELRLKDGPESSVSTGASETVIDITSGADDVANKPSAER